MTQTELQTTSGCHTGCRHIPNILHAQNFMLSLEKNACRPAQQVLVARTHFDEMYGLATAGRLLQNKSNNTVCSRAAPDCQYQPRPVSTSYIADTQAINQTTPNDKKDGTAATCEAQVRQGARVDPHSKEAGCPIGSAQAAPFGCGHRG